MQNPIFLWPYGEQPSYTVYPTDYGWYRVFLYGSYIFVPQSDLSVGSTMSNQSVRHFLLQINQLDISLLVLLIIIQETMRFLLRIYPKLDNFRMLP
jgi:hypothetical protein